MVSRSRANLVRAIAQVRVALIMRRHLGTLGRKAKETIMTARLAQVENMHQRRARNGRQHVRADGKLRVAVQKGNARGRAAVGAVAEHGHHFAAPQRGDERNRIGRRAGQRQEPEFRRDAWSSSARMAGVSSRSR